MATFKKNPDQFDRDGVAIIILNIMETAPPTVKIRWVLQTFFKILDVQLFIQTDYNSEKNITTFAWTKKLLIRDNVILLYNIMFLAPTKFEKTSSRRLYDAKKYFQKCMNLVS